MGLFQMWFKKSSRYSSFFFLCLYSRYIRLVLFQRSNPLNRICEIRERFQIRAGGTSRQPNARQSFRAARAPTRNRKSTATSATAPLPWSKVPPDTKVQVNAIHSTTNPATSFRVRTKNGSLQCGRWLSLRSPVKRRSHPVPTAQHSEIDVVSKRGGVRR